MVTGITGIGPDNALDDFARTETRWHDIRSPISTFVSFISGQFAGAAIIYVLSGKYGA